MLQNSFLFLDGVGYKTEQRLWRQWERRGDERALEKLVEYNLADTANLKPLANILYRMLREKVFRGAGAENLESEP